MVYTTLAFIPLAGAVSAFLALASGLKIVALLLALSALISTASLCKNRGSIRNTVRLTTAAHILKERRSIFTSSFIIVFGYLAFSFFWLVAFSHVLLLGQVEREEGKELIWRLSGWSYVLQTFFVGMFLWTTGVFTSSQKVLIGRIVADWYFGHQNEEWVFRSMWVVYYGQIALSALVLSLSRGVRLTVRSYTWMLHQIHAEWLKTSLSGLTFLANFLSRLVEHVSDYALYQSAISSESFFSSGRTVYRLFRRNMLLAMTTDLMTRTLFLLATGFSALLSGLAAYLFAVNVVKSEYGWVTGALWPWPGMCSASLPASMATWWMPCSFAMPTTVNSFQDWGPQSPGRVALRITSRTLNKWIKNRRPEPK